MEFDDVVRMRKSCRSFNKKKVTKKSIMQILEAGRLAPSARNRQPWTFYVYTGEEKQKLAKQLYEECKAGDVEDTGIVSARLIEQSSVFVLSVLHTDNYNIYPDLLSLGGCLEHMVLKATDLGIASLWLADVRSALYDVKKFIDTDGEVFAGLCFGYTDKKLFSPPKKTLKEIVKELK